MARGKKTGGRDFKPGQPALNKPQPIELKEARRMTKTKVEAVLQKFLGWTVTDLRKYAEDQNNPVLEMYVARILVKGISEGDTARLNFLFDRLIGKVKEVKEITTPKPTVIKMLDGKTELILGAQPEATVEEILDDENNS